MSQRALSTEEIRQRLIRLRNLETLHEAQRFTIGGLRDENRALKSEVAALKIIVRTQQRSIEDLKLQIEELRTIVFGKKRRNDDDHHDDMLSAPTHPPASRANESYKRKIPNESEITQTTDHPVSRCAHCGGKFGEQRRTAYFEEDIPLPQKKTVIRHIVEKGYCGSCERWSMGASPPSAPVVLGKNVKRYVAYLSVVCRQSYSQIQDVLKQTYDFDISQGEIAKILEQEGERLRPAYERLKASIRGEPSVHLDETGWNLFIGDGYRRYAWTMTGGTSADAAFVLGTTRGRGNAEGLLGTSRAVVVSDDYGAYRNLNNPHQLCLAHILRKLRDLVSSRELGGETYTRCVEAYRMFANIYADIEAARTSPDPVALHDALQGRLKTFATAHVRDPAKLRRVKEQVDARTKNYLTCLTYPGAASDNNAAERSLRHLVLKRKISFGSLTERTAETMAILLSVLLSWKRRGELRNYLMGV